MRKVQMPNLSFPAISLPEVALLIKLTSRDKKKRKKEN